MKEDKVRVPWLLKYLRARGFKASDLWLNQEGHLVVELEGDIESIDFTVHLSTEGDAIE
ncbi:MAG: hypothetical protein GOVbin4162_71 [Prokaryotic dsDNA virus sp.]|nr:MAG: hypothetical protein GOVbin4162_71 [Prokaryotic dsDNA virus sp.]|tara:strand:+ start:478 stop:654 length:177 start_codon:yes stop_codon:yes gene_type:complete